MMDRWTPGLLALHKNWTRAVDARFYMRDDKAKWKEIERRYETAEKAGDQQAMTYWVEVSDRFADEATKGSASWPEGKPRFLQA